MSTVVLAGDCVIEYFQGNLVYMFVCLTTDLRVISCGLSDYVMKHRVCVCVIVLHKHPPLVSNVSKIWNPYPVCQPKSQVLQGFGSQIACST